MGETDLSKWEREGLDRRIGEKKTEQDGEGHDSHHRTKILFSCDISPQEVTRARPEEETHFLFQLTLSNISPHSLCLFSFHPTHPSTLKL